MKKNLYPKFIVEGDCLIMSAVTFHKELATVKTLVKGGGWYKQEENKITFYGRSYDFGEATPEDILSCIVAGNIFGDKKKKNRLSEAYKFFYENDDKLFELK
jgi:hypothetical protein